MSTVRTAGTVRVVVDDPTAPRVRDLVAAHAAEVADVKPAGTACALRPDDLRPPAVTFWSAWEGAELVGCGALRELDATTGELKSLHTRPAASGCGVGSALVEHIVSESRRRGYRELLLETGAAEYFTPARRLYDRHGFVECAPFGGYEADPNNVYLRLDLDPLPVR